MAWSRCRQMNVGERKRILVWAASISFQVIFSTQNWDNLFSGVFLLPADFSPHWYHLGTYGSNLNVELRSGNNARKHCLSFSVYLLSLYLELSVFLSHPLFLPLSASLSFCVLCLFLSVLSVSFSVCLFFRSLRLFLSLCLLLSLCLFHSSATAPGANS